MIAAKKDEDSRSLWGFISGILGFLSFMPWLVILDYFLDGSSPLPDAINAFCILGGATWSIAGAWCGLEKGQNQQCSITPPAPRQRLLTIAKV
ncbi:MAG: hypothetical protein Q4D38_09235 [Planctomycetia bacterium]|nr:hypothetical protein [Planctomycetia bacterium]